MCCLLFFITACASKSHYNTLTSSKSDSIVEEQKITAALDTIYQNQKMVKQGDLIVRTGRDFTSEIMRRYRKPGFPKSAPAPSVHSKLPFAVGKLDSNHRDYYL